MIQITCWNLRSGAHPESLEDHIDEALRREDVSTHHGSLLRGTDDAVTRYDDADGLQAALDGVGSKAVVEG